MNIGIVSQWYPPETGGGGVATYNLALARTLQSLGANVTVVSATREATERVEDDQGVQVFRVPRPRVSARWDRVPVVGGQVRALRTYLYAKRVSEIVARVVEQKKLDLVEYADVEAEGLFHHQAVKVPNVVRLHGSLEFLTPYYRGRERPFSARLIGRAERRAVLEANSVTAPTAYYADLVSKSYSLPRSRIKLIPNLYLHHPCHNGRKEQEELTVLFVGRLEWRKGADTFAEAIPIIASRCSGVRFVFLAWDRPRPDGTSMKAFITRSLEAAGCLGRVSFETEDAAQCLYARLKPAICVVPSRFETFSYPCLESMSHGIPVIASRATAMPEVVEDEVTGILTASGNAAELAEAVLHLAREPELRQRLGAQGYERARSEFDPALLAQRTLENYEATIQRCGRNA